MNTELFTIYDKVAEEAGPIFQAKNLYVAMRYVKEMIKDNKLNLTEYDLVRLGSFDSESMFLSVLPKADAVELSNISTSVDDAKEFMKSSSFDDYGSAEVVADLDEELSKIKENKN